MFMKKSIILSVIAGMLLMVYISSCYNNRSDIAALPKVSFLADVVPIMTSGGCGCHNNVNANSSNINSRNAVPFTRFDTVFAAGGAIVSITRVVDYGSIIARVDTMRQWVEGIIGHPGGGVVDFTARQKEIIRAWIAQGPPYDGGAAVCEVAGAVTWTIDILPIYNGTCKSSGCHGGRGPALDYNSMKAKTSLLMTMMNSGGASGHPGGNVPLTSCTIKKFKAWIEQGTPQ
jgi:hypothetical protein